MPGPLAPSAPVPELGRVHGFQAMGSPCRLRVAGAWAHGPQAAPALAAAEAEVRRIEAKWSRYREDSVVSRLNAAAGQPEPQPVDEETAGLLRFADQLFHASQGRFDLTSGVLRRAWDFRAAQPPRAEAVAALLPHIGWGDVVFDGQHLRLPRPGMELDVGGLGKEYAADRAATLLMQAGCTHGYVNLGGDLRLLGPQPDGRPWPLGIAHPRREGDVIATLALAHGALATSGDYERFLLHEGRRYSHILNPRTGWPVRHWQSVSVVAPACLAAGALCTVAMLLEDAAPDFLREQGVNALLVDAQGRVLRLGDAAEA